MIKRTSFAVAVKKEDLKGLLREAAASATLSQVVSTGRPQISLSATLASLRLFVEGEDRRVDAFEKQVKESPLVYKL